MMKQRCISLVCIIFLKQCIRSNVRRSKNTREWSSTCYICWQPEGPAVFSYPCVSLVNTDFPPALIHGHYGSLLLYWPVGDDNAPAETQMKEHFEGTFLTFSWEFVIELGEVTYPGLLGYAAKPKMCKGRCSPNGLLS